MARPVNDKFEIRGVNHLALTCKDMTRTVDFYSNVLGMPLIKTINLPYGMGQHFFFDIGNGDSLAFFYFPDAPEGQAGVTHPEALVGRGRITTAHASMNHLALDVAPENIEAYRERLLEAGIEVTDVVNHDDSELGASPKMNESTFVRSLYFFDPDGILLEFAAWTRELGPSDADIAPESASA